MSPNNECTYSVAKQGRAFYLLTSELILLALNNKSIETFHDEIVGFVPKQAGIESSNGNDDSPMLELLRRATATLHL